MLHRIDVHHHVLSPEYVAALAARGIKASAGADLPTWTPEIALDVMDQNGIRTALTSVSSPGVYFGDASSACHLARICNEFSACMVRDHPKRFGFFAVLPMPIAEAATAEAVYALDTLRADGVGLLGSSGDRFLGDPDFEELMAELNKRKAVVFIHPNVHPSSQGLKLDMPGFLIEFLFDTTRAVVNLVLTGALERHPKIRWILSHAGGTVPFIAWRLALADGSPIVRERAPKGVLSYLKRLYYDTALSPSPSAMRSLKELVESTQILFGSDFPFAPGPLVTAEIDALSKLEVFSEETRMRIERDHALALFPRLREE